MPEVRSNGNWTLDKRVPLGIIMAIVVQTIALGMYIGSLDARVAQIEQNLASRVDHRDRLVVLETQMTSIHDTLLRIERRLETDDTDARRARRP